MEDNDIQRKDKIVFSIGIVISVIVIFFTSLLYYKYVLFTLPKPTQDQKTELVDNIEQATETNSYKQLNIQVLNGSGSPGVAGKLLLKLKDLGYTNIAAGNYESVVVGNILFAPDESPEFIKDLKSVGFSEYEFKKSDTVKLVIGK